jgi:hypothetical protein
MSDGFQTTSYEKATLSPSWSLARPSLVKFTSTILPENHFKILEKELKTVLTIMRGGAEQQKSARTAARTFGIILIKGLWI